MVNNIKSSSYYYWKKSKDNNPDTELLDLVRLIQNKNKYRYGAIRITAALKNYSKKSFNHKRVARIMRTYGLNARIRRRKFPKHYYKQKAKEQENIPKNILNRNFSANSPMEKLVTDITYLPTKDGWCYLNAILDLYNKEIISYRISKHQTMPFVLETVKKLAKNRDCRGIMFHSDQGFTYTNTAYRKLLNDLGMVQSMSRRGNCWDNAYIENFFGHLKSELYIPKKGSKESKSFEEIKNSIDQYIYWYNNDRIQKKLGYKSPIQFRIIAA